jgi:integrase
MAINSDTLYKNLKPNVHPNPKVKIDKEKFDYTISDGQGLHLLVKSNGKKVWEFVYTSPETKKRKKTQLGHYPLLSLLEARKKKMTLLEMIKIHKICPIENEKRLKKLEDEKKEVRLKVQKIKSITFQQVANERLAEQKMSKSHYTRTNGLFRNYGFPFLGSKPILDVTADNIREILRLMEKKGVIESARKLFSAINETFEWAINKEDKQKFGELKNPCLEIRINKMLPKTEVQHFATFTSKDDIKHLLLLIDEYGNHFVKLAFKFMYYTAARTKNIILAEWSEIDFEKKLWSIPGYKMKNGKDYSSPLVDEAIEILLDMKEYTADCRYIFPSIKSRTSHISDGTLIGAIRRMGFTKEEFTPHGFRAMFSTICNEKSTFKFEVIETQLAHVVGNTTSQAYNRALYLEERTKLLRWWADYLNNLKNTLK